MKLTLALLFISVIVYGQDKIELKQDTKAGVYTLTKDGTIPPDTTDCKCKDGAPGKDAIAPTVTIGTTSTLPAGSAATATDSDHGPNMTLNLGIPRGADGTTSGGSNPNNQTKNTFDITLGPWNVKGDGIQDDGPGIQGAINSARLSGVNGEVIFPGPSNFYRVNNQINVHPDGSGQVWTDLIGRGGKAGMIRYFGPANTSCFDIVGMKQSKIEGLHVSLDGNTGNRRAFDIRVTPSANSSTGTTMRNCYIHLGGGQDNIGVRTGLPTNNHHGDISNWNFENVAVYGPGEFDVRNVVAGQYAFQNLGQNTLSMAWYGGFVAGCDRAYTNITRDGQNRGNGSCLFDGLGGSKNNIDFVFSWEQVYGIKNGRWEAGNMFIVVTGNGAFSHITVDNTTVHDYNGINGSLIDLQGQCSLVLSNSQLADTEGAPYSSPIKISSGNKYGTLKVNNCSFTSNVIYTKTGGANFAVRLEDNVKLGYGFQSSGLFNGNQ